MAARSPGDGWRWWHWRAGRVLATPGQSRTARIPRRAQGGPTPAMRSQRNSEYVALHRSSNRRCRRCRREAHARRHRPAPAGAGAAASRRRAQARGAATSSRSRCAAGVSGGSSLAVFTGPDGATRNGDHGRESRRTSQLRVNSRYPDGVPLSTMPPQVLLALPTAARSSSTASSASASSCSIVHAHIIVDYIDDALPTVSRRMMRADFARIAPSLVVARSGPASAVGTAALVLPDRAAAPQAPAGAASRDSRRCPTARAR